MKKVILKIITLALVLALIVPAMPASAVVTPKLNVTKKTITGVSKKYKIKLTAPAKAKVSWKSSKKAIATVNSKGVVTSKKKGTSTITCTVKTGATKKKLKCKVIVKVPSKGVTFSNAMIDPEYDAHIIKLGTTYNFNRTLISSSKKSASSDVSRFYISDTSIATVNVKNGIVTPIKQGITTLTVSAGFTESFALNLANTKKQSIRIKVVAPSISVTSYSLTSAKTLALTFSEPINESTVLDSKHNLTSNVSIFTKTINNVTAASLGATTGSLSADKKTLTIQSTNAFDGTYVIDLSKSILSTSGYALEPYHAEVALKDNIGPSFIGCTTDESGVLANINFNEPIDITNLVAMDPRKSNNAVPYSSSLFTTTSNYKLSKDKKSLTIDLSNLSSADKNSVITIKLAGIVDLAGNTTNPYPLTVSVYTDTTTKPQASCTGIVRNGNSLVASFNRTMQTPGYAIVKGSYVTGRVNEANKKEVIYDLSAAGLTSLTGSVAVTLTGFCAYNATPTATQYSASVSFQSTAMLPIIEKSVLTTKNTNGVAQTVLTLTYNKNVTINKTSGTITGISNIDGVIGANATYTYTATVKENEVSLLLSGTFVELGYYVFTLPADFVKDNYNNYNTSTSISATKITGDSQVLPAPASIQLDATNRSIIYITFNNMLDTTTAQSTSNYSISGLSIASAEVIANNYNTPSIVKLTLASNSTVADIPYQVTISGIKGYKGSYATMNTYKEMMMISSNKTFTLGSYVGTASTKKVVLSFSGTISNSSVISYVFTSNGKTLTLKSTPAILGNSISFEFIDTIATGTTISMEPTIKNSIIDLNNKKLLNQSYTIIMH